MSHRLAVSCFALASLAAVAQVNVNVGGPGGVEVSTGAGTKVKVGSGKGAVEVKTGSGATKVKTGGGVEVNTGAGATTVKTGGDEVDVRAGDVRVDVKGARRPPPPPPAPAEPAAPASEADDDVSGEGSGDFYVTDDGKTVDHTCAAGEEVRIAGNSNAVALHGPCAAVWVTGNGNRVKADQVGAINATGNQNAVGWRSALKGRTPKVSSVGNGNSVAQER